MGITGIILHLQEKITSYEAYANRIRVASSSYDEHRYLIAGWTVFQRAINRIRQRIMRLRARASIEALELPTLVTQEYRPLLLNAYAS